MAAGLQKPLFSLQAIVCMVGVLHVALPGKTFRANAGKE